MPKTQASFSRFHSDAFWGSSALGTSQKTSSRKLHFPAFAVAHSGIPASVVGVEKRSPHFRIPTFWLYQNAKITAKARTLGGKSVSKTEYHGGPSAAKGHKRSGSAIHFVGQQTKWEPSRDSRPQKTIETLLQERFQLNLSSK